MIGAGGRGGGRGGWELFRDGGGMGGGELSQRGERFKETLGLQRKWDAARRRFGGG